MNPPEPATTKARRGPESVCPVCRSNQKERRELRRRHGPDVREDDGKCEVGLTDQQARRQRDCGRKKEKHHIRRRVENVATIGPGCHFAVTVSSCAAPSIGRAAPAQMIGLSLTTTVT